MKLFRKTLKHSFSNQQLSPILIISLGFLAVILVGAFLICLPISTKGGNWLNFIDALFTSTSAVCVTGLTVTDTTSTFSIFGQIIILLLIQTGGLGVMGIATLVFFAIRKRITLRDRITMQQAIGDVPSFKVVSYIKSMAILTFGIEAIGTIALMPAFIKKFGASGVFKAIFISISSFCNAGFDILGETGNSLGSLTGYYNNVSVMLSVSFLIILGGLGFWVFIDLFNLSKNRKLSLHSKIVLIATAVLLCSGTVFYLVAEWNNTLADMNFGYKLLNAFFMAVTPRTAGYYSVDLTKMTLASRFFTILLMFIGASPASTGGGIKTTTAVILLFAIFSGVNNQNKIILNKRYINSRIILRAVALSVFFVLLICLSTIILMLTESNNMALQAAGSYNLETLFFETVSALSTVGLTLNATPLLSVGGKIIIMITMFMGRVGPLTIGLIFLKKIRNTAEEKIRYPEAMIMIG